MHLSQQDPASHIPVLNQDTFLEGLSAMSQVQNRDRVMIDLFAIAE